MVGERVTAALPHPQLGVLEAAQPPGAAGGASMGAGKLKTKVRVVRAWAQCGVPAGRSSFPCQDPLRSCTGTSSWARRSHCAFPPWPLPAAGAGDCRWLQ